MNCGSYTGNRSGGKRSLEGALSGRYVEVMEGNSGISCLVVDDDATLREVVLHRRGSLTEKEYCHIMEHAVIEARIVAVVDAFDAQVGEAFTPAYPDPSALPIATPTIALGELPREVCGAAVFAGRSA